MHILYLTQVLPYPLDAGPKIRAYHVLEYLVNCGHEITLLSFIRDSDEAGHIEHLRHLCADVRVVPIQRSRLKDGFHLFRSLILDNPFLISRDWSDPMDRSVASIVAENSALDAVHADQLWMAQYALAAKRYCHHRTIPFKTILDQHNAVHLIPKRLAESESNPLKRRILEHEAQSLKRYEEATCALFDNVIWVTGEDRFAVDNFSKRSEEDLIIPICIDPQSKLAIDRQAGTRHVTFMGGLHWPPNAEGVAWFVQKVWSRILVEVPDAHLTVIGKDPPGTLLKAQNNIPNIEFIGYIEDPEPLLARTAVFIVPLHAGGGMRVKIIDAWSWALPIVSTTVGAEGIQYENGVDILIADHEEAFARAVVNLLIRSELAESIGRKGREKVATHYDWRISYQAWDHIYPPPVKIPRIQESLTSS